MFCNWRVAVRSRLHREHNRENKPAEYSGRGWDNPIFFLFYKSLIFQYYDDQIFTILRKSFEFLALLSYQQTLAIRLPEEPRDYWICEMFVCDLHNYNQLNKVDDAYSISSIISFQ